MGQSLCKPAPRLCGSARRQGHAYIEIATSPFGDSGILCPPIPVDAATQSKLGITPQGMCMVTLGGVEYLFDWVGAEFAPNVADIFEEGYRIGWSRHIQRSFQFDRIKPGMQLLLAHPKGWIGPLETGAPAAFWNDRQYPQLGKPSYQWWTGERDACPRKIVEHTPRYDSYPPKMCAGLWWEDCETHDPDMTGRRTTTRSLPCGSAYMCAAPAVKTEHHLAIIARLPIGQIAVVAGDHNEHEETLKKCQAAGVPVSLVKE